MATSTPSATSPAAGQQSTSTSRGTFFSPTAIAFVGKLTNYTTPDYCTQIDKLSSTYQIINGKGITYILNGTMGYHCTTATTVNECLPSAYASYYTALMSGVRTAMPIFEMGDACPAGLTAACRMENRVVTSDLLTTTSWSLLGSKNVAIGCCPRYYKCEANGFRCTSAVGFDNRYIRAHLENACAGNLTSIYQTVTLGYETTGIIYAPQLLYLQNPNVAAPEIPGPTPSGSEYYYGPSDELSAGKQAAIGVSISLFVIIIFVISFLLFRRRKKRRQQSEEAGNQDNESSIAEKSLDGPKEMDAKSTEYKAEMKGEDAEIYEMPGEGILEMAEDAFAPAEMSTEKSKTESDESPDENPDESPDSSNKEEQPAKPPDETKESPRKFSFDKT